MTAYSSGSCFAGHKKMFEYHLKYLNHMTRRHGRWPVTWTPGEQQAVQLVLCQTDWRWCWRRRHSQAGRWPSAAPVCTLRVRRPQTGPEARLDTPAAGLARSRCMDRKWEGKESVCTWYQLSCCESRQTSCCLHAAPLIARRFLFNSDVQASETFVWTLRRGTFLRLYYKCGVSHLIPEQMPTLTEESLMPSK